MTRSVSGNIVLYLNGAECQTGSPPFFRHFRLAKERVIFFHDDHEKNMDPNGVVRRIVMLKKALSREDVAKLNGCALPDNGATCEQNLVLNAVYKSHTYSSCGGGRPLAKGSAVEDLTHGLVGHRRQTLLERSGSKSTQVRFRV